MISKDTPFIDIHTHRTSGPFLSFGIHPWWFDDDAYQADSDLVLLENILKAQRIAAIGEVGIDRGHHGTIPQQLKVFEQQILLAEVYQKPLIIHNVRGTDEILRMHKKHQPKQAWIIHGFNGTEAEVRQLTDRGLFLSVGESLFYPNRKIHESIKSIPLDDLFLETDVSEKSIQEVYDKAAERLNLSLEVLKERIFANFVRLKLEVWNSGMTEPGCLSETLALRNLDRAMC